MSTLRKWTEDEEKVVISKIEENPNNLQKAFREASLLGVYNTVNSLGK